jgi:competence protein ComEC
MGNVNSRHRLLGGIVVALMLVGFVQGGSVAPSRLAVAQEDPGPLRLYFLNVGQGDAALLVTPDGVTILVDGGDNDRGNALVAWLRSQGIDSIDWIMPSHPHADHIGGLNNVLAQMEVRGALVSAQPWSTQTYNRQMQLISNRGIPLTVAEEGTSLQLGSTVTATVLNPPAQLLGTEEPVEDNSVVLRVCHGTICVLFTGDIGDEGEDLLLNRYVGRPSELRSHILKVSHHGSREPNLPPLLELIRPEAALIGVGEGNTFGHPTETALGRLAAVGARIYRTDRDGTILVEIYQDRYEVHLRPEVAIASNRLARPPTSLPIGRRSGRPVIYDPSGPDRDCTEFSIWEEAQDFYEAAGGPDRDPHRLDPDRNGVACQSLPGAPSTP